MKKFLIGFIVFSLVLFMFPAVASADSAPTIDGTMTSGEWGDLDFSGQDYDVYVLNDEEYLYIAFKALAGDFTIASSMTNIYIYAGGDYAGECWAYTVAGWVGDVGLDYFTIHHIQPPKVKEGKEARTTIAEVGISSNVMEWKIPLSEFPMGPGDTIAFDFMSFSEGSSSWSTAWLYEKYYTLSVSVTTKAGVLIDSGVPGKGLDAAPGLNKPFNPNSQAGEKSGQK